MQDFKAPWGDRRQEIVFIGLEMNHKAIQEALDDCLLDDDEFSLGLDGWKATMGDMLLFGEACINYSESDEDDAMEEEDARSSENLNSSRLPIAIAKGPCMMIT